MGVFYQRLLRKYLNLKTKKHKHLGDCTIYSPLKNGSALDGICVCGYGWECVGRGDWGQMFSTEWYKAHKHSKCSTKIRNPNKHNS